MQYLCFRGTYAYSVITGLSDSYKNKPLHKTLKLPNNCFHLNNAPYSYTHTHTHTHTHTSFSPIELNSFLIKIGWLSDFKCCEKYPDIAHLLSTLENAGMAKPTVYTRDKKASVSVPLCFSQHSTRWEDIFFAGRGSMRLPRASHLDTHN